jgi:hypothetical protein
MRQSPRQWYKKFHSFMMSQNYTRSEYHNCVYFKKLNNGIFIILVLYVDDMLLSRKIISDINRLKDKMARAFYMKDIGARKKIFSMEILEEWYEHFEKKPIVPLASHFKVSSILCPSTKEENEYMS